MKRINEEDGGVAANSMGDVGSPTSNIAIYDRLLGAGKIDPRLQKVLDKLEGGDSPGKRAVQSRIISAWVRMHGLAGSISDSPGAQE